MCSIAPRSTQTLITHVLQSSSLNTTLITQVLQSSSLNTKHYSPMCFRAPFSTQIITSIMCFKVQAQQKTSHQSCALGSTPNTKQTTYIYIINNWITSNMSNKSSCSYAMWSSTEYIKIKHQGNIIINGAHTHKC